MSEKSKKKKDDWFRDAVDEVVADKKVQSLARSVVRAQALGEAADRMPGRANPAAEAIREFSEAAYKITWARDGGSVWAIDEADAQAESKPPTPEEGLQAPTPEEGLQAILEAVRTAGDSDAVFKAGGEWIAKITNGISEEISKAEQDRIEGF